MIKNSVMLVTVLSSIALHAAPELGPLENRVAACTFNGSTNQQANQQTAAAQNYWPQATTSFLPRSQSRDNARKISGIEQHFYQLCLKYWWGSFIVTPEFTQSFDPDGIAQCLFGPDIVSCNGGNRIAIQGSLVPNRQSNAWLADYFYLPTDYNGSFTVEPRITNFDITPFLHLNMDEWWPNLYFNLWGTFVWAKWDLNFCECIENVGTNSHVPGYFNAAGIPREALLDNFASYITGSHALVRENLVTAPLMFTRMTYDAQTRVGFADLRWELGWNFHVKEDDNSSRFGINIQGAAPTGNKPNSLLLFNPMIGNGNHWELGVGFTAHHIFWRSQDCSCSFGLYFDAAVTHLFASRALRTFDLCRRPNSRYALAAQVQPPVLNGLAGRTDPGIGLGALQTPATTQFKEVLVPVANLTTLDVKITIAAQADVAVLFNYQRCQWDFDLGYNFWIRSREKFKCVPSECNVARCNPSLCDPSQQNKWVLKGDSRMYGFVGEDIAPLVQGQPVALSPSQNFATINTGGNRVAAQTSASNDPYARNDGIDNAQFAAVEVMGSAARLLFDPAAANTNANQIKTSMNPIYLNCADLDFVSTRGDTHKIFGHINYTCDVYGEEWQPYVGIGAFAEFAHNSSPKQPCDTLCNLDKNPFRSINCALSQWGIWLKSGVTFYTA